MIWINNEPSDDEVLADINQKLAAESLRRNRTPDPELGGLSPEQVARLIYTPWESDQFPIHTNDGIPLKACEQSLFFRNCRRMLTSIKDADGVKITSGGNFTRAFVEQMTELLEINQKDLDFMRDYKKTLNEEDVWEIHLTRIICVCSKMVRKHKGKFRVPKKHIKLLNDSHAGKLYKQLFLGFLAEFNMSYMDRRIPCYAIQQNLPYSLYQLSKLKQADWIPIEELPTMILLPAVLDEVAYECSEAYSTTPSEMLAARALKPLIQLGLLEGKHTELPLGRTKLESIALSPLFNEFMSFSALP